LQIAVFADTIIASFLSAGALSALYYADRLNQLPIGVIGIAAGTVVLPEMASRIAAGDEAGAAHAQNRAIELTLLLSLPCLVAFLLVPDLIMRVLFMRGAFTAADAAAAGATLAAYALGLLPFVLIRTVVATFLARGDTATPVRAALIAAVVNIGFKIVFYSATSLAQVGLAFATTIGAWLNFGLVLWFARRRGRIQFDAKLARPVGRILLAAVVLAIAVGLAKEWVAPAFSAWPRSGDAATLAALAGIGGLIYGGALLALYRPR
jgi:putative peptidoglycan lipid II flippase